MRIVLHRNKKEEDAGVHLWFENKKADIVVSLVGGKGDISTRVTTPKGFRDYGHPFADVHWTKYKHDDFGDMQRYKDGIVRILKRDFDYDVEVK